MTSPPSFRQVTLRTLEPRDTAALFRWSTNPRSAFRWRFGGGTPSPAQFAEALWSGVLCQFVVVDEIDALHGLVVCYAADHQNGFAYLGVQGNPSRPTGAGAMIGLVHLIDHVFAHWHFRKLYAEIPGYNEEEFAGALRRHLDIEGRQIDHLYHDGKFWDLVTCTLTRERWMTVARPRFQALLPGPQPTAALAS